MATLKIYNNTANPLSYLSSAITIAANGNTTVPSNKYYELAQDGVIRHDLIIGTVYLNDGDDLNYGSTDGTDYLDRILSQNATLTGATDGTRIGNIGDRLKVDAAITSVSAGVNSFTQKLRYDDMNVANGGVARGTTITEAVGWVQLYSYTGNGVYTGLSLGLASANTNWQIRLVLDSANEVFGSNGILTSDVDGPYGLSVGTQNTITTGINLGTNASFFFHSSPTYNPIKFASKIEVYVKRKTGGGSKLFNAGVIVLTKEV